MLFRSVGSSKDTDRRVKEHLSGKGAAFTRSFKPTGAFLPRLGNVEGNGDSTERDETLRYMFLKGVKKVRGWKFTQVDLSESEMHEAESMGKPVFYSVGQLVNFLERPN